MPSRNRRKQSNGQVSGFHARVVHIRTALGKHLGGNTNEEATLTEISHRNHQLF